MSAKDPDVRPKLESTLLDQLARSEERIVMLEAQLASAQKSLSAERAERPQMPATPSIRPPISMSAFNNNPSGPSTEAVVAIVRTAANARNVPAPFPSLSDTFSDALEPTARLEAEELRHAHRALKRPRSPAYRRIEAGLLCLACGALWAGVWQMQASERPSRNSSVPQGIAAVPPAANAYAVPPVPVLPVSVAPFSALASAQREVGRSSVAASTMNGKTMVEPDAALRIVNALRSPAHISPSVSAPRQAQTIAANSRQGAVDAESRSHGRLAAARRSTPSLSSVILFANTPTTRHEANRRMLAVAHTAGSKHNSAPSAHLIAYMPRRTGSSKPESRSAFVSDPLPEARSSYGLGAGRSESSEEQVEEQSEAVHGGRTAAYGRDDRRDDIEANVDHAIQTLDKMKELLDGMEHRRKAPAHP